jgi:hypothetical protein
MHLPRPVQDMQLIRDVQIMNCDPFSSFPCFNKIHAYEWHIDKSLCQFRMRKSEANLEKHENDASVSI